MKYTVISMVLCGLFFLGRLIVAVMERGWPTQPLYYMSSVIEIGLGFLTYKLLRSKTPKRMAVLVVVLMLLCIGIPVVFYNFDIEFLKPIGGAQIWYLFTIIAFGVYGIRRRKVFGTELTRSAEERIESFSKIIVFILPIMIVLWFLDKF